MLKVDGDRVVYLEGSEERKSIFFLKCFHLYKGKQFDTLYVWLNQSLKEEEGYTISNIELAPLNRSFTFQTTLPFLEILNFPLVL